MSTLKERLTAFYGVHNPEKLSAGLDQVVSAYEGKEEQLNAALRQQYGVDLTTTGSSKTDLRERLVGFYKVFNPSKISSADLETVTKMFQNNEEQLNEALRRQYGTDLGCLQKNFTEKQYAFLSRLAEFYKGHNQTRLMEGLDDLALHFTDKQEKLNGALITQYNAGLTSGAGITGTWLMKQKLEDVGCEFKFPVQLYQTADGKVIGCGYLSVGARCVFRGSISGATLTLTQEVNGVTTATLTAPLQRQKYIQGQWSVGEVFGAFQADKLDEESWIFDPAAVPPAATLGAGGVSALPDLGLRARLSAFYAVHNPEKLSDPDGLTKIVDAYSGEQEEELNYALQNQYGKDLTDSPGLSGVWSIKIIDAPQEEDDRFAAERCPGLTKVEYRYDIQLLHHKTNKVEGYGHLSPDVTFALGGEVKDGTSLVLTQTLGGGTLATLTANLERSKFIKGVWATPGGNQGIWTADKQGGRDSI